jgi:retron-type reverse transcriptase
MKRKSSLYCLIPTPENLCLAFRKAAKGKETRQEVIAFRRDFETNIQKLREQLLKNEPDVGHYRFFCIRDPKQRQICAASFPERVLHHAVMNIFEPVLESYAIYDSYACRKDKGAHKALKKAQKYAGNHLWYLKLDIRKYFDSIDHGIMIRLLSRRIKDKKLMLLFQTILETYHTEPGKGVPIGNLISQHLANFYLGCFDHWIKEERRIRAYLRYMDDFVLFGHNKAYLKSELEGIRQFLKEKLSLELKDNIQLNRCSRGIPFLGYRVFPGKILLSPRSRQRFSRKFREYEKNRISGRWSSEEMIRHMEPLIAFTKTADSKGLRRYVIDRFGVLS